MSSEDIIQIIGIVVSFFVGGFSLFMSIGANKRSKESNKISKEALQLSKEINGKNLENISIELLSNPIVLRRSVKIDYKDNENADYNDYYLILNMRINNKSFQSSTINEVSAYIRKKEDETYFNMDDLVDVVSYIELWKKYKIQECE